MHFLSDIGKHHGESGILADGDIFLGRDVGIAHELIEHVAAGLGPFAFPGAAHGSQRGFRETATGLHGQFCHGVAYEFEGNFSHGGLLRRRLFRP